jgi:eukaryotic-like serine/threonine-protein kinase
VESGQRCERPTILRGRVRGSVYFGDTDNCLHAVDAATGEEKWKFQAAQYVHPYLRSTPVVADGLVYFGTNHDGYLWALDAASGEQRWRFKAEDPIVGDPSVLAGMVYVSCRNADAKWGHVYALDAKTGVEKWRFIGSGIGCPAVADGVVYVDSFALDASTGQQRWTYEPGLGDPAVFDGAVYVGVSGGAYGDGQAYLGALDSGTGQEKWKSRPDLGEVYVASPSLSGGLVYFGTGSHVTPGREGATNPQSWVNAVDAVGGQQRWAYFVDKQFCRQLAIADGVVYVVTEQPGQPLYVYALK